MFPNREGLPARIKRRVCTPDPFQQVGLIRAWHDLRLSWVEVGRKLDMQEHVDPVAFRALRGRRALSFNRLAGCPNADTTAKCTAGPSNLYHCPCLQIGLVPYVDTVHNRLTVEIRRGCTRGCRCAPAAAALPCPLWHGAVAWRACHALPAAAWHNLLTCNAAPWCLATLACTGSIAGSDCIHSCAASASWAC